MGKPQEKQRLFSLGQQLTEASIQRCSVCPSAQLSPTPMLGLNAIILLLPRSQLSALAMIRPIFFPQEQHSRLLQVLMKPSLTTHPCAGSLCCLKEQMKFPAILNSTYFTCCWLVGVGAFFFEEILYQRHAPTTASFIFRPALLMGQNSSRGSWLKLSEKLRLVVSSPGISTCYTTAQRSQGSARHCSMLCIHPLLCPISITHSSCPSVTWRQPALLCNRSLLLQTSSSLLAYRSANVAKKGGKKISQRMPFAAPSVQTHLPSKRYSQ